MRLLADHDVWKATADLLQAWGHDLVSAKEIGMARCSDRDLLMKAGKENRLLVTRDKGFGSLAFLGKFENSGVIFLRIQPDNQDEVHAELKKVLDVHSEDELQKSFCTVEPGRHRIRRIRPL